MVLPFDVTTTLVPSVNQTEFALVALLPRNRARNAIETSGGASSEKSERNGGGGFDVIFNLKVYPTNFMPFFFDNFCQLLGFWEAIPPVPTVAPPLQQTVLTCKFHSPLC